MSMQNFVEFNAEFPDGSGWDAAGNLLTPGGHEIVAWLLRSLQASGFDCGEVTQKSFYGWQFQVRDSEAAMQVVLQHLSLWLLIFEPVTPLWRRLLGGRKSALEPKVLSLVDSVLKHDPRISDIRWFTREEYEAGENVRRRPKAAP